MKNWRASVKPQFGIGGHTNGGTLEPIGTVHLNGVMADAGTHTGREVKVSIHPDALDIVARIVADAIKARGSREGK